MATPEPQTPRATVVFDWRQILDAALEAACIAVGVLAATEAGESADDEDDADPELKEAADLLGVSVDARPEEVRSALRARMTATRAHPDHGGDEEVAKRLIAAKNLLIQRIVEVQP